MQVMCTNFSFILKQFSRICKKKFQGAGFLNIVYFGKGGSEGEVREGKGLFGGKKGRE